MTGYHYTLVKHLDSILEIGLQPHSLSDDDYANLSKPFGADFPTEGIHVFREKLTPRHAFLVMAWLALGRDDYNICLLQVEYDEKDTQQRLAEEDDETVTFHSNFSIRDDGVKEKLRFDLIFESVPPENIKLLKTWRLLDYADHGLHS